LLFSVLGPALDSSVTVHAHLTMYLRLLCHIVAVGACLIS